MRSVTKNEALIVGRGVNTSDGIRVDFFEAKTGSKLFTADFTDSTLNFMNGKNIEYDTKGKPIHSASYKNNILHGLMQKWDAAGRMTDSINYIDGILTDNTKFSYTREGQLIEKTFIDSVKNKMTVTYFDPEVGKTSEALFVGNLGVWNHYKNGNIVSSDSIFTRELKDASYPGGPDAWRRHLEKNLDAFTPVRNGAPVGTYNVIIQFAIDAEGKISNITPLTQIGYGLEEEAVKVIKSSGKWIPAQRFGKNVKAYRKQPVSFRVQRRNTDSRSPSSSQRTYGF